MLAIGAIVLIVIIIIIIIIFATGTGSAKNSVEDCKDPNFVFDNKCLSDCSDYPHTVKKKIINDGVSTFTCGSSCPKNRFQLPDGECANECDISKYFTYNALCLEKCPEGSFKYETKLKKACFDKCPAIYVVDG